MHSPDPLLVETKHISFRYSVNFRFGRKSSWILELMVSGSSTTNFMVVTVEVCKSFTESQASLGGHKICLRMSLCLRYIALLSWKEFYKLCVFKFILALFKLLLMKRLHMRWVKLSGVIVNSSEYQEVVYCFSRMLTLVTYTYLNVDLDKTSGLDFVRLWDSDHWDLTLLFLRQSVCCQLFMTRISLLVLRKHFFKTCLLVTAYIYM